jgi:hypothetical protein
MTATVATGGNTTTLIANVAGGWVVTYLFAPGASPAASTVFVVDSGHSTAPSALSTPTSVFKKNAHTVAVYTTSAGWVVLYTFATARGSDVTAVYVPDASHAINPADFASADYA